MGYRLYLGGIPKEKHAEVEDFTVEQWVEKYSDEKDEKYCSVHEVQGMDCFESSLFEFGKYFDVDALNKDRIHFFANIEVEGDLIILDKEKASTILDHVRTLVLDGYKKEKTALENFEKDREFPEDYQNEFTWQSPKEFLMQNNKNKIREWSENINPEDARFWEYQYFALMYLIGTFDWENKHMVYYGW